MEKSPRINMMEKSLPHHHIPREKFREVLIECGEYTADRVSTESYSEWTGGRAWAPDSQTFGGHPRYHGDGLNIAKDPEVRYWIREYNNRLMAIPYIVPSGRKSDSWHSWDFGGRKPKESLVLKALGMEVFQVSDEPVYRLSHLTDVLMLESGAKQILDKVIETLPGELLSHLRERIGAG
ncbi:hypothetical protein HZC00_01140 [Candidatus Kaiserbacteria bacterium]|nr:hypothetical protein [Candidatus Kaiserbacteria bacterium]